MKQLDVRPGEDRAFARTFTLDGIAIVVQLRWLPRVGLWLLLLRSPAGDVLSLAQMVRPGSTVVMDTRDPRLPSGRLVWSGPDDYVRSDLGATLRLLYIEPDPPTRILTDALLRGAL